jgi:hypothetical protein
MASQAVTMPKMMTIQTMATQTMTTTKMTSTTMTKMKKRTTAPLIVRH